MKIFMLSAMVASLGSGIAAVSSVDSFASPCVASAATKGASVDPVRIVVFLQDRRDADTVAAVVRFVRTDTCESSIMLPASTASLDGLNHAIDRLLSIRRRAAGRTGQWTEVIATRSLDARSASRRARAPGDLIERLRRADATGSPSRGGDRGIVIVVDGAP